MLDKNKLPQVKGKYRFDVDLSKSLWFQTGGKAAVIFRPYDKEDLAFFLKNNIYNYHIIGAGSNLIVRDGGFDGVIIRLGSAFNNIKISDEYIELGCSNLNANLIPVFIDNNIGGLEFLSGIPGSIGGAIAMNAGCYNSEIADFFISATAIKANGEIITLHKEDIDFSYRYNNLAKEYIFLDVKLKYNKRDSKEIAQHIQQISQQRNKTQPVKTRTGGSSFKNPKFDPNNINSQKKAWQLIDKAGCRGYKIGGAMMNELHCNFMNNTGGASSADLEELGNYVKKKVKDSSDIELEWEIKIIGKN